VTCNAYLSFDNQCREAFQCYERVLGGKILMMQTHGESPIGDQVPPEWRNIILHARLEFDGQVLMGSDAPPGRHEPPKGFMVALSVETVARAEAIFNALAQGGRVQMPFEETFWAKKFGMVTDRFGIPWVINGEPTM
jgi:PhnB protein